MLENEAINLEEYGKDQNTFISQSSNLGASESEELGINLEWQKIIIIYNLSMCLNLFFSDPKRST